MNPVDQERAFGELDVSDVFSKVQHLKSTLQRIEQNRQNLLKTVEGAPEALKTVFSLLDDLARISSSLFQIFDEHRTQSTTLPPQPRTRECVTSRSADIEHRDLQEHLEKRTDSFQKKIKLFEQANKATIEGIERSAAALMNQLGTSEDVLKQFLSILNFAIETRNLFEQSENESSLPPIPPAVGSVSSQPDLDDLNLVANANKQLEAELRKEMELKEKEAEEEEKRRDEERKARRARKMKERSLLLNALDNEEIETRRRQERNDEEKRRELEETLRRLGDEARKREAEIHDRLVEEEKKMAEHLRKIEAEREEKLAKFETETELERRRIVEKNIRHIEEMRARERHLQREKEKHEETMESIHEEYEKRKEKSARMWETRQRKMREQFDRLIQMQRFQVWNAIIENNWTNRLNVLRCSGREVEMCYSQLHSSVHSLNIQDAAQNTKPLVLSRIQSLVDAVHHQKQLMEQEMDSLHIMYTNTRKAFVAQISECVGRVVAACGDLDEELKKYSEELSRDIRSNHLRELFAEVSGKSRHLSRCSTDIPTLSELKMRFREEMNSQNGDRESSSDVVVSDTVRIEEIE